MEERVKELENEIITLRMEIDSLKTRLEDIKPFAQFAREQEEAEEAEERYENLLHNSIVRGNNG
jgi:regulator of replication initiation timing